MGFAPTWLRQVSPNASHDHFNHCVIQTFSSGRNYTEYKKVRNKVTAMIHQDHLTQCKLVQSFKQNQKKFCAYVRIKQSVKMKVCRILKSDGSKTSSDKETADVLGEQFQSVFARNEN